MKLLGIDHGTNYLGWSEMIDGQVNRFGLEDYTEIKYPNVLQFIHDDMIDIMCRSEPDMVILEQPVHFRNANVSRILVGAYTCVYLAALNLKIPVCEIKPKELKMITDNGNADKWDVAVAVQQKFNLDFDEIAIPLLYKRDDPNGKWKKGDVKDRLYDPADAIALCWAYEEKVKKEEGNKHEQN